MTKTRASVLIFEDDLDLARQWKYAFEPEGVDTVHAWSVDAVLSLCQSARYDAIVCDLFLEDPLGKPIPRAGITLLNYLKYPSLHGLPSWTRSVPIVAVTGSPKTRGFDVLALADGTGASAVMRKPFKPAALVQQVLSMIGPCAPDDSGVEQ